MFTVVWTMLVYERNVILDVIEFNLDIYEINNQIYMFILDGIFHICINLYAGCRSICK